VEVSAILFWNVIITLVFGPIIYGMRANATETKRIDILVNKTREEVASKYVTKEEFAISIDRVIDRLDKLDEKMDRLITG